MSARSFLLHQRLSQVKEKNELQLRDVEICIISYPNQAIIFLLIYTNPPLFISNLNVIRRLAPPELIRKGEQAYHYCSICSGEFVFHELQVQ